MSRIHLGTSGFSYADWRPLLYPEGLAQSGWLKRYAEVFTTVEVNATFYRLPTEKAARRWREQTPDGFLFSIKGSRYLSHLRRLKETGRGIERFFTPLEQLGPKLGPVLWQLPPQWKRPDPERLEAFIQHLPRGERHVFEFRAEGWYDEEILELLDRYGAAVCEHDLLEHPPPRLTGDIRYLRFHGDDYGGRYGRRALADVANDLAESDRETFVYFNNDREGAAVLDALELSELLDEVLPSAHPEAPGIDVASAALDERRAGD